MDELKRIATLVLSIGTAAIAVVAIAHALALGLEWRPWQNWASVVVISNIAHALTLVSIGRLTKHQKGRS